jgi:plasmid stability protein
MNATIRNIDGELYRLLKARAAREGRTIGDVLNDAMRTYLRGPRSRKKRVSVVDIEPWPFPEGNERLSEQIDEILYGWKK